MSLSLRPVSSSLPPLPPTAKLIKLPMPPLLLLLFSSLFYVTFDWYRKREESKRTAPLDFRVPQSESAESGSRNRKRPKQFSLFFPLRIAKYKIKFMFFFCPPLFKKHIFFLFFEHHIRGVHVPSVTRRPFLKTASMPSLLSHMLISGPPPWTSTGRMPTVASSTRSDTTPAFKLLSFIAAPPYLITIVFPRNLCR